jgi:hypothetical protein
MTTFFLGEVSKIHVGGDHDIDIAQLNDLFDEVTIPLPVLLWTHV